MTDLTATTLAQTIWDYMDINDTLTRSDIIIAFGSTDIRTARRAAELYLAGYAPKILMTGGFGAFTKHDAQPEAERYRDEAIRLGVPSTDILIEDTSSNSGENIQFSYTLLRSLGIQPKIITLVQKPYMQRRVYATFMKQWPDQNATVYTTSPRLSLKQYLDTYYTLDYIINTMVGDLQRIKEYPKQNFQIEQSIPDDVWSAFEQLVALGFTERLIH